MQVMITDCNHKDVAMEKTVFAEANLEFALHQCKSEVDVIKHCQGAVAVVNQYAPMNRKVFENLPSLKCIVRYGVGYDNVNVDDATEFGIQVCNVPDYGTDEVADHALALMLTLVRKLHTVLPATKAGSWDYKQTIPIRRARTQTIGVLGVGRIGGSFAKKVAALGYKVIGYDIKWKDEPHLIPPTLEAVSFEELITTSDIISIHTSLNETTRMLFDQTLFSRMKRGVILINVSRGGIVDEEALVEALKSGQLASAAMDVAKQEPVGADSALLRHENLLVTPHMAWYSEEAALEMKRKAAEEAVRFIRGEAVHNPINVV
jgi:D-3-phosphoglycerate dehydrogenase